MMVILSFLLPEDSSLSTNVFVQVTAVRRTFDGVGLGQLGQIRDKRLGYVLPRLALSQPQVYVCTGELVYVELETQHKQVRLVIDISERHGSRLIPCRLVSTLVEVARDTPRPGSTYQTSSSQPCLMRSSSVGTILVAMASWLVAFGLNSRTLKLVLAYVDIGGWVDHR